MKTYRLISGALHGKRAGEDCYCALGIYAEEKFGAGACQNGYGDFVSYDARAELAKMAEFLAPLIDAADWLSDALPHEVVYWANDRSTGCPCGECGEGLMRYKVPAEKIKEALALVGIDVELIDMRGKRD